MGVFETILELSGKEIVPFLQESAGNISNSTYIMLVAASECHQEKYGLPPVTRDLIKKTVRTDGTIEHFNQLIAIYSEFLNPSEPGEVKAPEVKQGKTPAKPLHGRTARK